MTHSNWKRNLILIFFLLAGVILGALLSSACAGIPYLSWLGYGKSVGIPAASPMVVDLAIVKIAFGFEMSVDVAQIFTIILAILCYKATVKKL